MECNSKSSEILYRIFENKNHRYRRLTAGVSPFTFVPIKQKINTQNKKTMATLKIKSITCLDTAETGADELYFTFNGTKQSLPNMTPGSTKELNYEFVFNGTQSLNLYENDGDHWYDRDDHIDSHYINGTSREFSMEFKSNSDDAHYIITATVNESENPVTARLQLLSITCNNTSEFLSDELYVTFNGTKVNLPNMTPGDTRMLNSEFLFTSESELCLFEGDGNHWYDRDDFIGKQTISKRSGEKSLVFTGKSEFNTSEAYYTINVRISIPDPGFMKTNNLSIEIPRENN